jgi:hypothetical protein
MLTTNLRAKGSSGAIATGADTFIILGCPFHIPATPPIPSPCLTVRWLITDMRVKANGSFTLSRSSQGLCMNAQQVPQGPVIIVNTQVQFKSQ